MFPVVKAFNVGDMPGMWDFSPKVYYTETFEAFNSQWDFFIEKLPNSYLAVCLFKKDAASYPLSRVYCEIQAHKLPLTILHTEKLGGSWQERTWKWQFCNLTRNCTQSPVIFHVLMFTDSVQESEFCPSSYQNSLLKSLCFSGDADLTLKSKDGIELKMHAAVVGAVSPVFQKMLSTDMKEKREGMIVFDDLGSKGVSVLKRFLYLGDFGEEFGSCTAEDLKELVSAGEKYALVGLRNAAATQLLRFLTVENAFELYAFMKRFDLIEKTDEVLNFIEKNMTMKAVLDMIL